MSVHTFVSITTTVAYICHELTITLPAFAHTINSDDAFCALLPEEVKATKRGGWIPVHK